MICARLVEELSSCYDSVYTWKIWRETHFKQGNITSFPTSEHKQKWLRCMWMELQEGNQSSFLAELCFATDMKQVTSVNCKKVEANLGNFVVRSLTTLFVWCYPELDDSIVKWFKSLIEFEVDVLGAHVLATSARMLGRIEIVKWLVDDLCVNPASSDKYGPIVAQFHSLYPEILLTRPKGSKWRNE